MLPEDVLLMMAQLGVAIAGFNGVAAALRPRERDRAYRGVIRSILLFASASIVAWAVFPLMLLTTPMRPDLVWCVSSGGWVVAQIGILVFRLRQAQRLRLPVAIEARVLGFLVLLTSTLQIGNVFVWGEAWPHVVAVSVNLVVAVTAFFVLFHEADAEEA